MMTQILNVIVTLCCEVQCSGTVMRLTSRQKQIIGVDATPIT